MTRYFILYHLRTVAFVLVVVVATFAVYEVGQRNNDRISRASAASNSRIVQTQLEACARGNSLRQNLNTDTKIIKYFMRVAAVGAAQSKLPDAKQRSALYQSFAAALAPAPLVDCQEAVR